MHIYIYIHIVYYTFIYVYRWRLAIIETLNWVYILTTQWTNWDDDPQWISDFPGGSKTTRLFWRRHETRKHCLQSACTLHQTVFLAIFCDPIMIRNKLAASIIRHPQTNVRVEGAVKKNNNVLCFRPNYQWFEVSPILDRPNDRDASWDRVHDHLP